jgi:hypothetical protein
MFLNEGVNYYAINRNRKRGTRDETGGSSGIRTGKKIRRGARETDSRTHSGGRRSREIR